MAGVEESSRPRIAILLALVGAGLILAGLALVIDQFRETMDSQQPRPTAVASRQVVQARAIRYVLFLTIVLVGVFSVATLAFLRWSRRFRRWLLRKPPPATPDGDVWAMHRLPEQANAPPDDELPPQDEDEYPESPPT
jgi:hypothetical protein